MSRPGPSTPIAAVMAGAGSALLVGFLVATPPSAPTLSHAPRTAADEARVSARGFTLRSTSVELPDDIMKYPDGPQAALMNGTCTACHSAAMALVQPPLTAVQWKSEVDKMRDTFKATVDPKDEPEIVAYLTKLSASVAARNGSANPT